MGTQLKSIGLSETVEIPVLNNRVRQFKFGDNETNLDQVLVHGVSIHTESLVKSPQSRTILPNSDLKQGFITLASAKKEAFNKNLPIETFFNNQNFILFFTPKLVSIRNSYVEFPQSQNFVIPADGYAVVVTFFYEKYDAAKHKINSIGELEEEA